MNKPFTNTSFKAYKAKGEKITMLTAYDYTSAHLVETAGVDTILVGDSLGMVVLGYDDTLKVTMDDMISHTAAVRRGAPNTFIVADMPYLSYHIDIKESVRNAGDLITKGGANAVKVEGGAWVVDTVKAIINAQIPVVAHLGLTPQSVNALGGFKVQGKGEEAAKQLIEDAKALEAAGASALVLECIPPNLAKAVSAAIGIPTIGIGAGVDCDGQVLVFHDMLGIYDKMSPKFVKRYVDARTPMLTGLQNYIDEVKSSTFPAAEHTFKPLDVDLEKLY